MRDAGASWPGSIRHDRETNDSALGNSASTTGPRFGHGTTGRSIQANRSRYMNEAATAQSTGARKVARSSHRFAVARSVSKAVALMAAATISAHPMNALALYQMSAFVRVTLFLKP